MRMQDKPSRLLQGGGRREGRGAVLEGVGTGGLASAGSCCSYRCVCRGLRCFDSRTAPTPEGTSPSSAMAENSDKVPITMVGPDDTEFCSPPVSTSWVPSPPVE